MANRVGEVTPEVIDRIAKTAAREIAADLRESLQDKVGEEVERHLKAYFGDMTAAQHSIQHANLEKLLVRLDNLSSGFYGGILSKIGSIVVVALIFGLAAWGLKNGIGN
ncbi:hypothetical protein L9H26_19245 [Morganella psychrotolerans]|uniref:Uncharacterized protein n=1 Tax=Morganella psychrotolerans TaxID=368603 RepID=A0A5M9QZQ1_9GAMM|nr:hypothetical protein [Morganella psychrotolerans]KAA8713036.1 hypothetical protein F4V73_18145 [Morganella psychrotolerans]OBU01867.1 hypothetical protein AYY16_16760 [Morganella psychrotolerans]